MRKKAKERPSLLIIDMVKDNFDKEKHLPITTFAEKIIEPLNKLKTIFREKGWPIVFATDAFHEQDFIFTGKMKPHSLKGSTGAEIIDELERKEEDLWIEKPRFSAFFRTDLDQWLKNREVTLCAVAGITTPFCVLATALDAICWDFKAVILEDCTAAASKKIHEQTLEIYRRSALYPLLKVASSSQLLVELSSSDESGFAAGS